MFETIVIPTDGSEQAEAAAERGFELARTHGAAVHVVCVADTGPLGDYRLPGDHASADEAIRSRAEEFVSRLADRVEDLEVTTAVPSGTAKNAIVDYAEDVDADLIVMGTRGRGGVGRVMLGSVAEHVVRTSGVDVMVVGGPD